MPSSTRHERGDFCLSSRIRYGASPPLDFHEELDFSLECPYIIRCKKFAYNDIAPLHCGNSIEILVCRGAWGVVTVNNVHHRFSGDCVICIPPNTVHTVSIEKGPGAAYVLHISPSFLSQYIVLDQFFGAANANLADFPLFCPDYDAVYHDLQALIAHDGDLFARMSDLLRLLGRLNRYAPPASASSSRPKGSSLLQDLITWTEINHAQNVTLEKAAACVGFSKSHFCSWFKRLTDTTYINYLTDVRISAACRLLLRSHSVATACYDSGFSSMSYFIQVFKKRCGCTPSQYIQNAASHTIPFTETNETEE